MTRTIRVLIADDAQRVRANLVRLVNALPGIDVVAQATDAEQAITQVAHHQPDVVILDLNMPKGGGLRALRQIRDQFPTIKVVILTNHANPFYRDSCLRLGAAHFFDKTIEFDKVPSVLLDTATA